VLVHGEEVPIEILEGVQPGERLVRFGAFHLRLADDGPGALPAIERHLRRLATEELPRRLTELAAAHGRAVAGVTIRAQRTRWGSCSPTGRISLNWRLIQLPPSVRDYVLLHELTHLIHLNHSRRFWRELERVCPWHGEARGWLRARSVSRGVR
jgi:predicted metal-dependent hydrolase